MKTDIASGVLDVLNWRITSIPEMRSNLDEMALAVKNQRRSGRKGSGLIIRQQLSQIDVFCYLKARFGTPNGFQNVLRKDDSDNLIHWHYDLMVEDTPINIMGVNREIHIFVRTPLSDEQWKSLITNLKNDYARVGPAKSAILKKLEKWVIFPNKFVQIGDVCGNLYDEIAEKIGGYQKYKPASFKGKDDLPPASTLKELGERAANLYGKCIELTLLTPILAEAFINMVIMTLCNDDIRRDAKRFNAFIRTHIHTKVFNLSSNCRGFVRSIDNNSPFYAEFKRVMDRRNHAVHGNIDPIGERMEIVYFEGKRPIYSERGDHFGQYFEAMERQFRPERVLRDYENTYSFLLEITHCMAPSVSHQIWDVLEDQYPGYDVNRRMMGKLFPDYVVKPSFPGIRYDDELEVDWSS